MDKNKMGLWGKEMDKIIPPDKGELPSVPDKDDCVNRLQKRIVQNKAMLPALYRYAPADVYTLLSMLNRNVYLMPASAMNDKLEGRVINRSAYECFILGKHTARNGVAGISPPRREFQKC